MNLKPQPSTEMGQLQSIPGSGPLLSDVPKAKQSTKPTPLYPKIASNKRPLSVGVMLDDWTVPAWIAEVLRGVQSSGVAELTTVILNREPAPGRKSWTDRLHRAMSRSSTGLSTLLWRLYVRFDERCRRKFATPFHPSDVRSLFAGAQVIEVLPRLNGNVHLFSEPDLSAIKGDGLDVILKFGFNTLRGDILSAARYGVWSYHHGDTNRYSGGPNGFWEMYERNPVTGTVLQVLTDEPTGGRVIYRTYRATRSFESLLVNRYWLYWSAIPFVTRCLRRISQNGIAGLDTAEPTGHNPRPRDPPRNLQMLRFLVRVVSKMIFVRIQDAVGIQGNHWFLALARGVAPGQQLTGKVIPVHPPPGRFWADPMLVRSNAQTFMFFEDYDYNLRRGQISVVEIDASGRVGVPQTALQADHHLSYPFVFEWRGEHFMIPETASVNAVQLYRCVEFPTRWEYVQDLLNDIKAVDATIYEHEGRWYLFTNTSEAGGSTWDELFLFVADTPIDPWTPHPMNPIVSDVRSARPGGALFSRDGVLYRPAQNSARMYGHSLGIFEITELTPERYAERLAYRIEPDWLPSIQGCHTISVIDDLMALDCRTVTWRPYQAVRSHSSLLSQWVKSPKLDGSRVGVSVNSRCISQEPVDSLLNKNVVSGRGAARTLRSTTASRD